MGMICLLNAKNLWWFDDSLCGPLSLIFQSCFENGKFPSEWKKANIVPTYKKNGKQLVKNYHPILLLPICGKIFEHLIYNTHFISFNKKQPISPNQSGFKLGDLYTNQLLAITHEIHKSVDDWHEVRGVFLHISEAFDKVWKKVKYIN